jgi:hypothetical protein
MATNTTATNTTATNTTASTPLALCTFPIAALPYELRQLIYASYLTLLPPLHITPATLRRLPAPALLRSSPLFVRDIAPPLFYQGATFSFTCVADLRRFAYKPHGHHARRIRILNHRDNNGGDWVYSAQKCFPALEEMVFELADEGQMVLEEWWDRVIDAVREGRGMRIGGLIVGVERGERLLTEVL